MSITKELKELENDFLNNKIEWENWSLYGYFESMFAWIKDSKFTDFNFALVYNCFLYGKNKTLYKPVEKLINSMTF